MKRRVIGNMLYPCIMGFMYGLIAWGPNLIFLIAFVLYVVFTYFMVSWMDKVFYGKEDKKDE